MRDFATNEAPFDYVGSLWQAQGGLPSKTVQGTQMRRLLLGGRRQGPISLAQFLA
jgi:hypothetical protein